MAPSRTVGKTPPYQYLPVTAAWLLLTAVSLWVTEDMLGVDFGSNAEQSRMSGKPAATCVPETPDLNVTLVTGYFDIGRGWWPQWARSSQTYIDYASLVLGINAAMVIYVEPEHVQTVLSLRRDKLAYTRVIPTTKYELELYAYIDSIREVMASKTFRLGHHLIGHPEGFSPLYNVVSNSKVYLVHNATKENPFGSDYFYWVDFGYGHGDKSLFPADAAASCAWSPREIMSEPVQDKITYLNGYEFRDDFLSVDDLMKNPVEPFIMGGFFGGSSSAIAKYYAVHQTVFTELLLLRKYVDDDQTTAAACYLKEPSLFHFVPGSWFDAFVLLGISNRENV